MSDRKTVVQDFQRDIDTGDASILNRYIKGDYVDHNPAPFASKAPGMAGFKETFRIGLDMFSEFKHVVDDQVAEGDKVATRITGSGRHVGAFLGIPPTNKMVTMSGIAIHRIADGRLVEHWGQVDGVGLLAQMGAIPAPPAPPKLPAPQIRRSAGDRVLSAQEMKDAIRSVFDAMNRRDFAALGNLIHPDYVNYSMPMSSPGAQALSEVLGTFISAFPDMQIVLDDVIAEPDKVATRGHFTGTHRGAFMNVPPTGKQVTVGYIDVWKAHNGRLIENWVQMDMLGLLGQLGVGPAHP